MQHFFKMQLVAVMIFSIGFSSCNKKDSTPKTDTKTLLTARTWKITEKAADDNMNGKIDANEFHSLDGAFAEITLFPDGGGNKSFRGEFGLRWTLKDDRNIQVEYSDGNNAIVYNWRIDKLTDKEFNYLETDDRNNNTIIFAFNCIPK